jgi:cell division protein ZapB
MEQKTQSQERRRLVLIFIIVGLVIANLLFFYLVWKNKEAENNQIKKLMEQQKIDYEKDLQDLSEKLKDQIRKTERLGEENKLFVDSLQKVLRNVEGDRNNLRNANQLSQTQIRQYKEKIDAYEILLRKKDEEIDKLRETAEILYKENNSLKNEKNELSTTINEKDRDLQKYQSKIDAAAVLKAENLTINAINNKGKETSGGQYRVKNIEKLSISFNMADNKLAKIGNKEVFMRILEPAGTVLYNPGSSGKFDLDGGQATYTSRQQILFDNSRQTVNFQFNRNGEYQSGRHTIELYCEGQRIGIGSFEVR